MLFNKFFKTYIDEKVVTVVFWSDKILLHQCLKTKAGFWMGVQPYFLIGAQSSAKEIGNNILKILEKPSYIIPTPKFDSNNKNKSNLKLKAANVKSEKEFIDGAKNIQIYLKNDILSFIPTKNGGLKGEGKGFRELIELAIVEKYLKDPIDIGNTTLQIKEKCVN